MCVFVFITLGDTEEEMTTKKLNGEQILRKLLWLRHGCPFPALYGDDGEMQCGNCRIDFKETSAQDIQKRFEHIGMLRFRAEQQVKPEQPQEEK